MTTPLWCLLGFAGWTMLLVVSVGLWRVGLVFAGKAAANAFPSGTQHGSDPYWRLNRAHLNAAENLPLMASVVLVGTLAGVSTPLFATLAQVYLAARIVQSLVHIASNAVMVVNLRFTALIVQFVCFGWMAGEIIRNSGAFIG